MDVKFDVTALGELLIDFTDSGLSDRGNPVMEANPGGAPCNVLAMLARLGHKTAFIGKIGADMFGRQLEAAVSAAGIDTAGLVEDKSVNTTLAFVHRLPDGDRDFSFYRRPGADMMLSADEVNEELIDSCRIFHFGTLSMTSPVCREATEKAVGLAKESGRLISFDPNIREPLWDDMNELRNAMDFGFRYCDILKISDNEIQWFAGESDYKKAACILKEKYSIPLILVSLGAEGSMAFSESGFAYAPAFKVETADTTGAGDCFCACALSYILKHGFSDFSDSELLEMLTFANAAAAIVTTRKGALAVMPENAEIRSFMSRN